MRTWTEQAERNEDGDLIYERPTSGVGGSNNRAVNLTTLLQPGERRSNDVNLLVLEARHAAAADKTVENPALPAGEDVAKETMERLDEHGLEPAWKVVNRVSFP